MNLMPQLCLGWEWRGYNGFPVDGIPVPRGMTFEAISLDETYPGLVNVAFRWFKRYRAISIDARWLIPDVVFQSRYVPGGKDNYAIGYQSDSDNDD